MLVAAKRQEMAKLAKEVEAIEKARLEKRVSDFCAKAEKEERYVTYAVFQDHNSIPALFLTEQQAQQHSAAQHIHRLVVTRAQLYEHAQKDALIVSVFN